MAASYLAVTETRWIGGGKQKDKQKSLSFICNLLRNDK